MRKLLLVLSLALVVTAPAFAIDDPSFANYTIKRGTGGRQSDTNREVRLVRYSVEGTPTSSQTRDLVSNDLVVWDTNSDDGVSVRMTATSADGAIAGVVCSTTILTADQAQNSSLDANGARNWGWIVVSGLTTVRLNLGGSNGAVIGDPFVTSRDTGNAVTFERSSNDTTLEITDNMKKSGSRGGFFFDTPVATDTSVEVYVQLN